MIHRHALRICLRLVAGLMAGLAVIAGFGFWLLSKGPLSLDSVAPLVASMLSRGTGVTAQIDHTFLSLGRGGHLDVLARGVHLRRAGTEATLTLGDLALDFSPTAALAGTLAPTRIIIDRPELRLDRGPDGTFHFGVGDLSSDAAEDWGTKIVGDLLHPPQGNGALGYLTQISVQDASLTVEDRALGLEWHAAEADATFTRSRDRTDGKFAITAGQASGAARLDGDFVYLPGFDQLVVRVGFDHLQPSQWSQATPALAGLTAVDVPISGEVRAEFDPAQLTLRDAIVDLSLGQGTLKQAFLAGGVLAIAGGKLQGGYDALKGRINLGLLSLDLDPGSLSVSGSADGVGTELLAGTWPQAFDTALKISAQGVRIDDFARLWPERASPSTRSWVTEHLHDGTVDALTAQVALHVDLSPAVQKHAQLTSLDGTMSFSHLTVAYFPPLPPVKNVDGTATISPTEITFHATGGDLGNIRATAATARFYKLDTNDEQAAITVAAQGPLADALAVLDTPPLYYARDIGLDPKRTSGTFAATLHFDFPLINHLLMKDIAYGAEAKLADVGLGAVMFDRDLTQGALQLKLDPNVAQVDGTAALAGVPLTLSWQQALQDNAAVKTRYLVKATLDDAQRQALGFDKLAPVTGTVAVDARYDLGAKKQGKAAVTLDLTNAAVAVKQLNWQKPTGVAATATLALDLADDQVTRIDDAEVKGGGMDAKAAVSFDDAGGIAVTIDHLVGGENDFRGSAARDAAGGWRIDLTGRGLDASGLADDLDKSSSSAGAEPPLAIEAKLDRLRLGPDRVASAVALSLASDGPHWQRASLDANLSDKTTMRLRYNASGDRPFTLTTDNFGALLKLLDIYDDIEGGSFTLTGKGVDRDGTRVLVAKAEGADYRVVRAPTLARLLSVASFSGISALLTGQGIPFTRVEGDAEFTTGKIVLKNARAYGGAIGINAGGTVDRAGGQLDIAGTLVPAYTLNSVIGDIPLIGNLLVGGAGQGVFASNFRLYGKLDNPEISVNALSTLAPGVLRKLFLFSPGGPRQGVPQD